MNINALINKKPRASAMNNDMNPNKNDPIIKTINPKAIPFNHLGTKLECQVIT